MTDKLFKVKVYVVETPQIDENGQMRFGGGSTFEDAIRRAYAQPIANPHAYPVWRLGGVKSCGGGSGVAR